MEYLKSTPFSTSAPITDDYRSRWENTFGVQKEATSSSNGQPRKLDTIQNQVAEFHRVYGQPIATTPKVPADDRVKLRLRLIAEEFFELLAACGVWPESRGGVTAEEIICNAIDNDLGDVDIVEVADALGDIAYVVEGANLEFGIPSAEVLAEIQRSNLSKLGEDGKPIYNEHGKVTKGPNYSPPDIAKVLNVVR